MYLNHASGNFVWLEKLLVVSRLIASEEMVEKQTLSQRRNSDISELIVILNWRKHNKNIREKNLE